MRCFDLERRRKGENMAKYILLQETKATTDDGKVACRWSYQLHVNTRKDVLHRFEVTRVRDSGERYTSMRFIMLQDALGYIECEQRKDRELLL